MSKANTSNIDYARVKIKLAEKLEEVKKADAKRKATTTTKIDEIHMREPSISCANVGTKRMLASIRNMANHWLTSH